MAIRKFLNDHPDVRAKGWTTSDINREVVRPESKGTSKPYIDLYKTLNTAEGKPYVAPATIFISHAWRYKFAATVADVIEQHSKTDPDAYYWFDLFTNDQNAVMSKDFEWFCTTFRESIRSIGHVLLVLSPWNDPLPIRRAWCLFEIANTLKETDIQFSIYLPTSEVDGMSRAVTEESDILVDALANIQAEKAEAKVVEDRDRIFEVIEQTQGGFYRVNEQVKKGLRDWYVKQMRGLLDKQSTEIELIMTVASVMLSFGFIAEAKSHVDTCLKMIKKPAQTKLEPNGKKSGTTSKNAEAITKKVRQKIFFLAGKVNLSEKNRDDALEYFHKSHELLESLPGKKDIQLAESYLCLGDAQICMRGLTEVRAAESYYNKAKEIIIQTKGEDNISMAGYFEGMAECSSRGDLARDKQQELEYTNKVCELRIAHYGEDHPITAKSYNKVGTCLIQQGKKQQGLEYYTKAHSINLTTYGELHESTATDYLRFAGFYHDSHERALGYYKKVLDIAVTVYGELHPLVAQSYVKMGHLYKDMGDHEKANEMRQKGYMISVKRHVGSESEENQTAMSNILMRRAQKGKL